MLYTPHLPPARLQSSKCEHKHPLSYTVIEWSPLSLTLEVKFLVSLLRGFAVATLSAKENKERRQTVFFLFPQLAHKQIKASDAVDVATQQIIWDVQNTEMREHDIDTGDGRGILRDPRCSGISANPAWFDRASHRYTPMGRELIRRCCCHPDGGFMKKTNTRAFYRHVHRYLPSLTTTWGLKRKELSMIWLLMVFRLRGELGS